MRGTVKAARLTGDPGCPDLLAVSVYDTKPVYFFLLLHTLSSGMGRRERFLTALKNNASHVVPLLECE